MAAPQYATATELLTHIDSRVIQMLASDDGTDGGTTYSNVILAAAVERASSDIESYARRGERYSETDLSDLQTAGDTTLIGLVADLTIFHLAGRRGGDLSPAIAQRGRDAHASLKALANGDRIFGKDTGAEGSGTAAAVIVPVATRLDTAMISDSDFFPPAPDRLY